MTDYFAGWLKTYDSKRDEENVDEGILIEVTEVGKDSTVEIAFDDRNERVYVRLKLSDLIAHACRNGVAGE